MLTKKSKAELQRKLELHMKLSYTVLNKKTLVKEKGLRKLQGRQQSPKLLPHNIMSRCHQLLKIPKWHQLQSNLNVILNHNKLKDMRKKNSLQLSFFNKSPMKSKPKNRTSSMSSKNTCSTLKKHPCSNLIQTLLSRTQCRPPLMYKMVRKFALRRESKTCLPPALCPSPRSPAVKQCRKLS